MSTQMLSQTITIIKVQFFSCFESRELHGSLRHERRNAVGSNAISSLSVHFQILRRLISMIKVLEISWRCQRVRIEKSSFLGELAKFFFVPGKLPSSSRSSLKLRERNENIRHGKNVQPGKVANFLFHQTFSRLGNILANLFVFPFASFWVRFCFEGKHSLIMTSFLSKTISQTSGPRRRNFIAFDKFEEGESGEITKAINLIEKCLSSIKTSQQVLNRFPQLFISLKAFFVSQLFAQHTADVLSQQ